MRWVVFSNLYVASCGAALTAASSLIIGTPMRLDAAVLLVFSSTLVIYNLDRLVEPKPGDSAMECWVERHRKPLWILTTVAMLGVIAITPCLKIGALASLPIAGAVAIGYCLPVLPHRRDGWLRLKALPGAKLLLIAGVWTYATLLLPMLQADVDLDVGSAAALVSRLLFIAAVALPFDVPDMQRDRQSRIVTIPTLLGLQATKGVALALAMSSVVVALFTPPPVAISLAASGGITGVVLLAMRHGRGVLYYMVALDGMLLVQAVILFAVVRVM